MPHLRKRYLTALMPSAILFSPIIGVLVHRQVGKTTLAEQIGKRYVSLDSKENRNFSECDPDHFLDISKWWKLLHRS